MDTNNFPNKVGVGERESRIYSDMVSLRHYSMGHGKLKYYTIHRHWKIRRYCSSIT